MAKPGTADEIYEKAEEARDAMDLVEEQRKHAQRALGELSDSINRANFLMGELQLMIANTCTCGVGQMFKAKE